MLLRKAGKYVYDEEKRHKEQIYISFCYVTNLLEIQS